ncbi:MAG: anti-sigma factor [Phyllobacteriaceae bacterium]|nr:anti-sigma factor [Phyllobacteriaceae bacterium]
MTPLLCGFVDGELDAAHALEIERHLAECPACRAELAIQRTTRERLARPSLRHVAPEPLRARILADLTAEAGRSQPSRHRTLAAAARLLDRLGRWSLMPSLAAAALAVVLFVQVRPGPDVEGDLVAGHVRSLLADHLTDVATSDRHAIKPWFSGKIDFSPPVVDLAARGFPLVGGRLDYVEGRVVAALVYRRHGHVVNLFVWPATAQHRFAGDRDGYGLRRWTAGGLVFWAVSDLDAGELRTFEDEFARAAPP